MQYTDFVQARRMLVHFVSANLSMSTFWHSNAKGARFSRADLKLVNFTLANLQKTEFSKTSATDEQLKSALSIRNARLSNKTLGRDRNLIRNGNADCNSSITDSWLLQTGTVILTRSTKNKNKCHFILQSLDTGAIMLQRVNLSDIWNPDFWPYSHAVLNAQMGIGVSIQIRGLDNIGEILGQRSSSMYTLTRDHSVHFLRDVKAQMKVT